MGDPISVLVASCQDDECEKISAVLSGCNDFFIMGIEKDLAAVIIKAEKFRPDVLIVGFQFSGIIVTDLAPIIRRRSPGTNIVVLCEKDESRNAGLALKAGIAGILLKETDTDKLEPILKIVFLGGYYISTSIINNSLKKEQKSKTENKNSCIFSAKEQKIISDLAQGFSDEEIAKRLNYSAGTIRNCVSCIKRKTKLKNRVQIALYSLISGIIKLEQIMFLNDESN